MVNLMAFEIKLTLKMSVVADTGSCHLCVLSHRESCALLLYVMVSMTTPPSHLSGFHTMKGSFAFTLEGCGDLGIQADGRCNFSCTSRFLETGESRTFSQEVLLGQRAW